MEDRGKQKRSGWRFAFIGGTCHTWRKGRKQAEVASEWGAVPSFSINNSQEGDRVWIVSLSSNSDNPYLLSLGLTPGTQLQIISPIPSGSVIVAYNDNRIGLGTEIANTILVTHMPIEDKLAKTNYITYLRDLPVGTRGRVVGYDRAFLGYMGRLLSMGLIPGTEFTVIRHAFFNYPLQIELKGNLLNLRKQEADALCVEEIEE